MGSKRVGEGYVTNTICTYTKASLMAQSVKNSPAMQETQGQRSLVAIVHDVTGLDMT